MFRLVFVSVLFSFGFPALASHQKFKEEHTSSQSMPRVKSVITEKYIDKHILEINPNRLSYDCLSAATKFDQWVQNQWLEPEQAKGIFPSTPNTWFRDDSIVPRQSRDQNDLPPETMYFEIEDDGVGLEARTQCAFPAVSLDEFKTKASEMPLRSIPGVKGQFASAMVYSFYTEEEKKAFADNTHIDSHYWNIYVYQEAKKNSKKKVLIVSPGEGHQCTMAEFLDTYAKNYKWPIYIREGSWPRTHLPSTPAIKPDPIPVDNEPFSSSQTDTTAVTSTTPRASDIQTDSQNEQREIVQEPSIPSLTAASLLARSLSTDNLGARPIQPNHFAPPMSSWNIPPTQTPPTFQHSSQLQVRFPTTTTLSSRQFSMSTTTTLPSTTQNGLHDWEKAFMQAQYFPSPTTAPLITMPLSSVNSGGMPLPQWTWPTTQAPTPSFYHSSQQQMGFPGYIQSPIISPYISERPLEQRYIYPSIPFNHQPSHSLGLQSSSPGVMEKEESLEDLAEATGETLYKESITILEDMEVDTEKELYNNLDSEDEEFIPDSLPHKRKTLENSPQSKVSKKRKRHDAEHQKSKRQKKSDPDEKPSKRKKTEKTATALESESDIVSFESTVAENHSNKIFPSNEELETKYPDAKIVDTHLLGISLIRQVLHATLEWKMKIKEVADLLKLNHRRISEILITNGIKSKERIKPEIKQTIFQAYLECYPDIKEGRLRITDFASALSERCALEQKRIVQFLQDKIDGKKTKIAEIEISDKNAKEIVERYLKKESFSDIKEKTNFSYAEILSVLHKKIDPEQYLNPVQLAFTKKMSEGELEDLIIKTFKSMQEKPDDMPSVRAIQRQLTEKKIGYKTIERILRKKKLIGEVNKSARLTHEKIKLIKEDYAKINPKSTSEISESYKKLANQHSVTINQVRRLLTEQSFESEGLVKKHYDVHQKVMEAYQKLTEEEKKDPLPNLVKCLDMKRGTLRHHLNKEGIHYKGMKKTNEQKQ